MILMYPIQTLSRKMILKNIQPKQGSSQLRCGGRQLYNNVIDNEYCLLERDAVLNGQQ